MVQQSQVQSSKTRQRDLQDASRCYENTSYQDEKGYCKCSLDELSNYELKCTFERFAMRRGLASNFLRGDLNPLNKIYSSPFVRDFEPMKIELVEIRRDMVSQDISDTSFLRFRDEEQIKMLNQGRAQAV